MSKDTHPDRQEPIALVVDDEPLIRMDACDIIADAGYRVVEAATADQAFAYLQDHPSLQLVFTDVQMPGEMSGFGLARRVAERWPHICVVVASGAAQPQPGQLPETARFIRKPFTQQVVLETLDEICPLPVRQNFRRD
jgi:CheY-like chemotaxis protein